MKFIHFGCWNKNFCDITKNNNGLSATMKELNNYINDNKDIDFIVIAGDNYYPDKKEKEKKEKKTKEKNMITKNFLSGVNCLPKHILKYVLLGNHEYDNMKVDGMDADKCHLLKTQKNIFNKLNNTIFFNDVIYRPFGMHTLIIMIDTTIYEMFDDLKEPNELNIYDTCVKYLFLEDDEINEKNPELRLTLSNIIQKQNDKIKDIIIKYGNDKKNIVLIGHHPIVTIKVKADTNRFDITNGLVNLYKFLDDILQSKNLYYLCADTHNYQSGKVYIQELEINQYITGTGGADQDICTKLGEDNKYDIKYKNIQCQNSFGFIVCNENKDENLECNFVEGRITEQVETAPMHPDLQGGYYKKYLKYKNKYLNLKINI